jgi:hypothetical protein
MERSIRVSQQMIPGKEIHVGDEKCGKRLVWRLFIHIQVIRKSYAFSKITKDFHSRRVTLESFFINSKD